MFKNKLGKFYLSMHTFYTNQFCKYVKKHGKVNDAIRRYCFKRFRHYNTKLANLYGWNTSVKEVKDLLEKTY